VYLPKVPSPLLTRVPRQSKSPKFFLVAFRKSYILAHSVPLKSNVSLSPSLPALCLITPVSPSLVAG